MSRKQSEYFARFPNKYIQTDITSMGLNRKFYIIYLLIDRHRSLEDISWITIRKVLDFYGYKTTRHKSKVYEEIIVVLKYMIDRQMISVKQDLNSIKCDTGIEIQINSDSFDCSDQFTIITSSQLDAILNSSNINRESLLLTFLYIKCYLYMDETQTEVMSYICVETTIPRVPTGTIKNVKLTIWAISHKECMKFHYPGYAGDRVDILSDMIDRIISSEDNCRTFGIGKPELTGIEYLFPQNKYYGRQMIYNIPDFKVKLT